MTHWFTMTLNESLYCDQTPEEPGDLDRIADLTDEICGKVLAQGCNDATLHSAGAIVYLSFAREADSLGDAIVSAIQAVHRAGYKIISIVCWKDIT